MDRICLGNCPHCAQVLYWEPGDDSIAKIKALLKELKRAHKQNAKRHRR